MEPNAFVAEVYRRISLRHPAGQPTPTFAEIENDPRVLLAVSEYAPFLPTEKNAAILDIGFGSGWFLAACVKLGYTNLSGAEFGLAHKAHIRAWGESAIALHEIEKDIGEFLSGQEEAYDFIHMSHVIEHIPKYSLLWVVDTIFRALKKDGLVLLRTPNMEGPTANSSLFVTLAHEYGFSGSNLRSLLDICGFDEIRFHSRLAYKQTLKQQLGRILRWPYLTENRIRHRLFGVNKGGQFDAELIMTARRGGAQPLFDPRYK